MEMTVRSTEPAFGFTLKALPRHDLPPQVTVGLVIKYHLVFPPSAPVSCHWGFGWVWGGCVCDRMCIATAAQSLRAHGHAGLQVYMVDHSPVCHSCCGSETSADPAMIGHILSEISLSTISNKGSRVHCRESFCVLVVIGVSVQHKQRQKREQ